MLCTSSASTARLCTTAIQKSGVSLICRRTNSDMRHARMTHAPAGAQSGARRGAAAEGAIPQPPEPPTPTLDPARPAARCCCRYCRSRRWARCCAPHHPQLHPHPRALQPSPPLADQCPVTCGCTSCAWPLPLAGWTRPGPNCQPQQPQPLRPAPPQHAAPQPPRPGAPQPL